MKEIMFSMLIFSPVFCVIIGWFYWFYHDVQKTKKEIDELIRRARVIEQHSPQYIRRQKLKQLKEKIQEDYNDN